MTRPVPTGDRLRRRVAITRRRLRRLGWVRLILGVWTVLALTPVVSTVAVPFCSRGVAPWVAAVFLAGGGVAALGTARRVWLEARPGRTGAEAARVLAGSDPEHRDRLVTAADLAFWEPGGAAARGVSPTLVSAQVAWADRVAVDLDPARAVSGGPATRALVWAVAATVVLGLWGWIDPGGGASAWGRLTLGGTPEAVQVGNLDVTVTPPAYTGQGATVVEGGAGTVRGYPGSRVVLSGRLSRQVGRGEWLGPEGRVVPVRLDGEDFSVAWLLDRGGSYRLRFYDGRREVPSDLGSRPVRLVTDEHPRAELVEPVEDLEISSDQEVSVRFRVSDDFGVAGVSLVVQGDEEVRVKVPWEPAAGGEGSIRFLPLAHPELGEGAHLRIEARDGDTVSGPHTGVSRSIYVRFLDRRSVVAEIQGLEERLLEALLIHLADHLERDDPQVAGALATLRGRARDVLTLLGALADRVSSGTDEGALGVAAVLKIQEGLERVLGRFLEGAGVSAPVVDELERDVLFLDRLLKNARMEETLTLGDELAALQRSLYDEITRDGDVGDLVERVRQIQDLLARMAAKMARAQGEMPDDFANADAVRDMPQSELQKDLEALRKALAEGDRDKARQIAERVLETVSRWMAALEDAAGRSARAELDPLSRELGELDEEVRKITALQERVLGETREVGDAAGRKAAERARAALPGLRERTERHLRAIQEAASRIEAQAPRRGLHGIQPTSDEGSRSDALAIFEARRRVGAAMREVREGVLGDLPRARTGAEALETAVADLAARVGAVAPTQGPGRQAVKDNAEKASREAGELRADLGAVGRPLPGDLGPGALQKLGDLRGREGQLGDRAGQVARRLADLARRTPLLDDRPARGAKGAQGALGKAGGRLGGRDPGGAIAPETEALEKLAEVSRQLQGAQQQMQGQGQGGPGFQMVRRPGGRAGGRDVDRSPVEIPGAAEARELEVFRRDVLRAMREGTYPKGYENDVETYYERLIR